jgi:hypothetical protein
LAGVSALPIVTLACSQLALPPVSDRPADVGLLLPWDIDWCFRGDAEDTDLDGIVDACELALARAFAPAMVVTAGGCDWDATAERPLGAYLYGVQRSEGNRVRVAYLPAYFRDCGWSGPKCLFAGGDCAGHTGDSEIVAVSLDSVGRRWWVTELVASAHCFGRSRGCGWRPPPDGSSWVDGTTGGAPVVFVAEGTHAGYASRMACDRGHWYLDTCDRSRVGFRFPVVSQAQNVGSRARPIGGDGCLKGGELPLGSAATDPGREECLWAEDETFRGWQSDEVGAPPTPYGRYLREVLKW